jgi:hypothetical protein
MAKNPQLTVILHGPRDSVPAGPGIYYLCLLCRTLVPSLPEESTRCSCGNVLVDPDAGRGGAKNENEMIILKALC